MSRSFTSGPEQKITKVKPMDVERCTFTLMTYNVNFGPFAEIEQEKEIERLLGLVPQCSRVIDAIAEGDADIVCLQETNYGISEAKNGL
jgi:mRNA deadenylase 3'-5' endonuclease subunit Ccr4